MIDKTMTDRLMKLFVLTGALTAVAGPLGKLAGLSAEHIDLIHQALGGLSASLAGWLHSPPGARGVQGEKADHGR